MLNVYSFRQCESYFYGKQCAHWGSAPKYVALLQINVCCALRLLPGLLFYPVPSIFSNTLFMSHWDELLCWQCYHEPACVLCCIGFCHRAVQTVLLLQMSSCFCKISGSDMLLNMDNLSGNKLIKILLLYIWSKMRLELSWIKYFLIQIYSCLCRCFERKDVFDRVDFINILQMVWHFSQMMIVLWHHNSTLPFF